MDQDTQILPAVQSGKPLPPYKWMEALPVALQLLVVKLLNRAWDLEPEKPSPNFQPSKKTWFGDFGWFSLLALVSTLGIFVVGYAFANSRDGGTELNTFFYLGLILIFVPTVIRLISPISSRIERIGLVCLVGISCYLVKVISSPVYFSLYDEFLHWRTAKDIARTGHLFTTNALLPVSPHYPGLEIVTNALSSLSGLDTFIAGLIVIGVARLLMVLSLFALYEAIVKSARIASFSTIIYMANSHFLLFDSQYGYESLALPLALFTIFALSPHQMMATRLNRLKPLSSMMWFSSEPTQKLKKNLRGITFAACLTLVALTATHHVTDFFLAAILIVWAIIYILLQPGQIYRSNLARIALFGTSLAIIYALFPNNPVVSYLSSFIGESLKELTAIIAGSGSSRQLFVTYSGQPTPLWERIISLSSVGLITLCLPFGMLCLWKRYRFNALTYTFGIITPFYPISQIFRFTNTGSELVDRAAPFLFIAISILLAIFIAQFWPVQKLNWKQTSLLTSGITLIFLGGIILAIGPGSAILPGPYEVIADSRSIEPEGIQAAVWAGSDLGANNRVATDRINQILMGTYGNQRVVTSIEDRVDLSSVFLTSTFGDQQLALLRSADVRYLVVDLRLTHNLPLEGYYYEQDEIGAFHHTTPIDQKALSKFNDVPQINRVFDSGDIVIYDVGGLLNAAQTT
jgi:hypothetical protein